MTAHSSNSLSSVSTYKISFIFSERLTILSSSSRGTILMFFCTKLFQLCKIRFSFFSLYTKWFLSFFFFSFFFFFSPHKTKIKQETPSDHLATGYLALATSDIFMFLHSSLVVVGQIFDTSSNTSRTIFSIFE